MRRAAYEIIKRKGATNHAIGLVTANLLRAILRDERRVLTVSRVQEGTLGVRELATSLPAVVGQQGATHVIDPELLRTRYLAVEIDATQGPARGRTVVDELGRTARAPTTHVAVDVDAGGFIDLLTSRIASLP